MPDINLIKTRKATTRPELLVQAPYSSTDRQKNEVLLAIIRQQLETARNNNRQIDNFFTKQGIEIDAMHKLEDVPFIPVQMFKLFDLRTCPGQEIVKVLQSSGTTGGTPSRIPLDKTTTLNQIKALKSILSEYLGKNRKIFLVIDHEGINSPKLAFSARTAGVRGLSIYAKKTFYLLREEKGKLVLNMPVIQDIVKNYSHEEVYAFGFTYIIWTVFYEQLKKEGIRFSLNNFTLFHGGGLEEDAGSCGFKRDIFRHHC